MMAMGMIALLVFLVSVVMIIVNFLRKRDNTIIFIIADISDNSAFLIICKSTPIQAFEFFLDLL